MNRPMPFIKRHCPATRFPRRVGLPGGTLIT
jgi:hypothetical protein